MALEDIGNNTLDCVTNQTACCKPGPPYIAKNGTSNGNWFFPNGTRVPSSGQQWDFHRTRDEMMVRLNRRRGGADGIYRCEIPDSMNVNQNIYIGVYTAGRSK